MSAALWLMPSLTKDLILRKAEFDDWEPMYRNVWSRAETAKYMAWQVTDSEEAARERILKTIAHQQTHEALALSCGFIYRGSRQKADPKSGGFYELEVYSKELPPPASCV